MGTPLTALAAGFGTGLSLIVAIGAQNAFVLRQGIRREAVLPVVAICAASDAVLIACGVGGLGVVVAALPGTMTAVRVVGVAFLLCYGALAARRAFRAADASGLEGNGPTVRSGRRAVLTCLAMTWLNPHVYLDTVLLLGAVAATHGALRWQFGLGAVVASLCWFAALGFGARLLEGFFRRPASWRALDGLVAATMLAVAATLATGS
ncbi:LysE/ArgO family amino acid transporter [Streptacidiphilus fuscans]|uniref:LysE family transporter n=1 Tax=Streptacidiphilus fuscans TaxID=2789292 RepID=A0A931FE14_9ACTN|nr:LysE family transporter [Streptacidiphilus fuscans]MBF9068690.1 LysE family transporter [Streptacidiphilus fuscans]